MRDFTINKSLEYKTKNLIPQPFGNQNIRGGGVTTLFSASEGIYAGGSFAGYFNRIARWDGRKWNKVGKGIFPEQDVRLGQWSFGFTSSIIKYKNELYAATRENYAHGYHDIVLHKFFNNEWVNIKYKNEESITPQISTRYLTVHDDFLYIFGEYGQISEYNHTSILKWDGSKIIKVDGGDFADTSCGLSSPDGLYVAGASSDYTGNKIKLLKRDNSWIEIENIPQGGEITSMKFINDHLHIAVWGHGIFKYNKETQTWIKLGELTHIGREFVKVNQDIYATGQFENEFGQCVSRWDGSNWHPLKNIVDPDEYGAPSSLPIISSSDGLYVGFNFQIYNSNLNSGSTVSRWDGNNWNAIDSQRSPASLTPNEAGIYHSNLLSCSEGVYTSGYFTERIMLWNGNEFLSLSGGLDKSEEYFNNNFVSHSTGIYFKDYQEDSIFSRWNGFSWEKVWDESVESVAALYLKIYNNDIYFTTSKLGEIYGLYKYDGNEFSICFEEEQDVNYSYESNFVSCSSGVFVLISGINRIKHWDGNTLNNITLPSEYERVVSRVGYNVGISEYNNGICAVLATSEYLTQSICSYVDGQWNVIKNLDNSYGKYKDNNVQFYNLHSSGSSGIYLICQNPLIKIDDQHETNYFSLYLFDGVEVKKIFDTNNTIFDLQETQDGIYICGRFDRQAIGICKLSKSQNITKPLIFTTNNVITTNKTNPYKVTLA